MVALSPSALAAPVLDETVVLDADRGAYFGLNQVGGRIWELLTDGPRRVSELVDGVVAEYDVERPRAEDDVRELVDRLAEHGLVDVR